MCEIDKHWLRCGGLRGLGVSEQRPKPNALLSNSCFVLPKQISINIYVKQTISEDKK